MYTRWMRDQEICMIWLWTGTEGSLGVMADKQMALHMAKSMKELNDKVSTQKLAGNSVKLWVSWKLKCYWPTELNVWVGEVNGWFIWSEKHTEERGGGSCGRNRPLTMILSFSKGLGLGCGFLFHMIQGGNTCSKCTSSRKELSHFLETILVHPSPFLLFLHQGVVTTSIAYKHL